VGNELPRVPQPFLGYYHFYPPHAPYNTSLEFFRDFREDGLTPIQKPTDVFAVPPQPRQLQWRTEYDEFILYADEQFGRLFDSLDASGLLDNSWVLFTSDHGEMFERGIRAHATETLYQPVIHIPLLIFEPGRRSRVDIQMNTSAVDVLPTLAHLTGHAVPDWSEGILLPPFDTRDPDLNRSVYVVRAIKTAQDEPLTRASIALIRGRYKLLYYVGYPDYGVDELAKLYDLQADPEELVDLYTSQALLAAEMLSELKSKLQEVNQPYL
jgi:choline-sulfatase